MSAISATDSYNRGLTCYAQGDLDAAITKYKQAIAIKPDYAAAFHNRGLARYDQGDLDDAIADYDQAIALFPDGSDKATAYSSLGKVLRQLERVQEAEAAHQRAIELDAARLIDWIAIADLARRRGDSEVWQRAIDMARTAG